MTSWQETSLLMRIEIDDVIDKVCADTAVIEQRIAFGRRSISRNGFAIRLGGAEKIDKCGSQPPNLRFETRIESVAFDALRSLVASNLIQACTLNMHFTAHPRGHHPEAATVRRQFRHVKNTKAMRGQYLFGGIER